MPNRHDTQIVSETPMTLASGAGNPLAAGRINSDMELPMDVVEDANESAQMGTESNEGGAARERNAAPLGGEILVDDAAVDASRNGSQ